MFGAFGGDGYSDTSQGSLALFSWAAGWHVCMLKRKQNQGFVGPAFECIQGLPGSFVLHTRAGHTQARK